MNAEILVFILYFVAVFGVSLVFFFNGTNKGGKDYFLGGRSMGPWVTAMSAQASDMSGWLLMGLPGSVLAFGFGKMWIGIGLAMGTAANWIFCAKRLRRFSRAANDSITLPEYLSNRFGGKSNTMQLVCAVVFLICFTVYVASAYVSGATVFTQLFPGVNERVAMIVFALLIIGYTMLGGFKAVCWTDFFQGILILIAMLAIPIAVVATQNLDTALLDNVYSYVDADGSTVECKFGTGIFNSSWQDIVSGLAWGLGYFGMPHILVRFMSIEKPSMIKKSATVAIIWVILTLGAACVIAYMGRMIIADQLLPTGSQSTIFIVMSRMFFPGAISGVLLAAIMAAAVSTADSQILVASSSFTEDIYRPLIKPGASDKETLMVGRLVVLAVAVVAFVIASSKGTGAQAIMNMVENAWGGFGSAFGPVILLSLFWRRFNHLGAVAGIITGALVDVLWLFCLSSTGVYELAPGFICGGIAAVVVTKLTPEPEPEVLDIYDRATDPSIDD